MQINCIYKALPFTGFFTPNRSGTLLQCFLGTRLSRPEKEFFWGFFRILYSLILSIIEIFLAKYEWAFRVNARRSESQSHVFSESSYIHD